jgi:hypothetical protein
VIHFLPKFGFNIVLLVQLDHQHSLKLYVYYVQGYGLFSNRVLAANTQAHRSLHQSRAHALSLGTLAIIIPFSDASTTTSLITGITEPRLAVWSVVLVAPSQ